MRVKELYRPDEWLDVGDYLNRCRAGRPIGSITNDLQVELFKQFYDSPVFAVRNFLYTTTKSSDLVKIDPWVGQTILDICLRSQQRRGFPRRVVEIKARQVGFTAWNLALAFHAALSPRVKVGILVNDEDVAADLSLRVGELYNNLPPWMRPMKRIDNPKQLVFDNPDPRSRDEHPGLNSRITITVPESLRGLTPSYFLWSEAAFTKDWQKVVDGVVAGIALNKKSCIVLDSTPNGHDDWFEPRVLEAVARNPKWVAQWERKGPPTRAELIAGVLGEPDKPGAGYVPAFCPFHWHEEFTTQNDAPDNPSWRSGQLPAIDGKELKELLGTLGKLDRYGGEEELELVERFGVSPWRLYWRRWKLDNDTMGADWYERLIKFRQEYGSDYRSMFITMGRGAFDAKGLDRLSRYIPSDGPWGVRPPAARGKLRRDNKGEIYLDQTFHSPHLEIRCWAPPESGELYAIGVDTATAWHSEDADYTVAQVIRRRDRKQVAVLTCKVPPHEYREQIALLYFWYNRAYLGVEIDNEGYDLVHQLQSLGCTNQYYYRRFDSDLWNEPTKGLGWETNMKTRSTLQNILVEEIARRGPGDKPEPGLIICDAITMSEFTEVTRDPEGRIGNWARGHDDHFFALGIALAIDQDPYHSGKISEKEVEKEERKHMNALVGRIGLDLKDFERNRPRYTDL